MNQGGIEMDKINWIFIGVMLCMCWISSNQLSAIEKLQDKIRFLEANHEMEWVTHNEEAHRE